MIRSLIRHLLHWPERIRFRRMLAARPLRPPADGPAVHYGDALQGSDLVAGGKVKLLHLRDRWPDRAAFNLLYLVSSAPPRFAGELVRWAKKNGARLVWNQNGVGFPAWAGWSAREINFPMARLFRQADHVIYQSQFCRLSADHWLGTAQAASSVLYNPVDLAWFRPEPAPREPWRLLAAGTHYQSWRVLGALQTLRELLNSNHRATLTVAGAMRWPGAEAEVHAQIARLRLAEYVTLRPAFTQGEAVKLYQSAHVLLHLKYHDPCPTVAIEALACGLPVVASRSGGMEEIVGQDGGALVHVPLSWSRAAYPPPQRLAAAVARVMANWPTHSAAARQRAEQNFGKEAWVEAHAKIFASLLPGR